MKFLDSIEISIKSGAGGAGMVSFRAARNLPKLGADGGDGGHGGGIYLLGTDNLNTLAHLYRHKVYQAEDGAKGGSNGRTGRCGDDLHIKVPLGTIARDASSGEVLAEVLCPGMPYLLCKGGHRGLGNIRFLSSIHQAPEEYTSGGEAVQRDLLLELKLIADVGFAGLPNAGKSTLLSTISAAQPKVADYPFTTLIPQLGVVDVSSEIGEYGASFVAADIPGLIEGASSGKGLGHEFLKHLERTKCLAFVIDVANFDAPPLETLAILRSELSNFSRELAAKPSIVVLTKSDQLGFMDLDWSVDDVREQLSAEGFECCVISCLTGSGIGELKRKLYSIVLGDIHRQKKEDRDVVRDGMVINGRRLNHFQTPAELGYDLLVQSDKNRSLGLLQ